MTGTSWHPLVVNSLLKLEDVIPLEQQGELSALGGLVQQGLYPVGNVQSLCYLFGRRGDFFILLDL